LSLVYFTDRDLGKRFPEILSAGGLNVKRRSNPLLHPPPNYPDTLTGLLAGYPL